MPNANTLGVSAVIDEVEKVLIEMALHDIHRALGLKGGRLKRSTKLRFLAARIV